MAETRRLWEFEQPRIEASLSTAQAATILGRLYFVNGIDTMEWSAWAVVQGMADKLKLFDAQSAFNSEKDRVSRIITA
jgi:hypothetical protein